jgi:hypothetical protein
MKNRNRNSNEGMVNMKNRNSDEGMVNMKNRNSNEGKDNIKELITETNVNVKEDENKESSSACSENFEGYHSSYELGYN